MGHRGILVTGGAGYIGSHTVLQLRERGERVVVLDDLSTGFREAVLDTPLVVGNVVKVHPLAVVLAVAAGGFLAGIAGALFAVPVVATTNAIIGYIARGTWRTNPHPHVDDVVPRTRGGIRRGR